VYSYSTPALAFALPVITGISGGRFSIISRVSFAGSDHSSLFPPGKIVSNLK